MASPFDNPLQRLIREIHWRRPDLRFGWILSALFLGGASGSLSAQADADAILGWARENQIALTSVGPGIGFADLQNLRPLVESARVVALGQPLSN